MATKKHTVLFIDGNAFLITEVIARRTNGSICWAKTKDIEFHIENNRINSKHLSDPAIIRQHGEIVSVLEIEVETDATESTLIISMAYNMRREYKSKMGIVYPVGSTFVSVNEDPNSWDAGEWELYVPVRGIWRRTA